MMQVLSRTPPWVFALFAGLLAFGILQARSRKVKAALSPVATPSPEVCTWRCWCCLRSCLPLSGNWMAIGTVTREPVVAGLRCRIP